MVFFELRDRLSRFFMFSRREIRDLSIAIIIVGFIFSFRDWGIGSNVDVPYGIRNFIISIVIAAISFFVHESAHRIFALWIGFKAEFQLWWGGLITSLVLAFASNGLIQLVLPGGMVLAVLVRHRLGEFRYGLNYWENGIIAMYGPLSNLFLAFIAKLFLVLFPASAFFQKLLFMNVIFAICTMLPIPPLDGVNTFFGGRLLFIVGFFGILGAGVLIYFTNILLSIVGGLIIALIATVIWYLTFEKGE